MPKEKFKINKGKGQKPESSQVEQFAEKAREENRAKYPWEDPSVREDKNQMVPLYLPETYKEKLKWISDKTNIAQQRILREPLLPYIDKKIAELIAKE